MSVRRALYPGSFDPLTLGHLDVLKRALRLFDEVIIGVAADGKAGLLSLGERLDLAREVTAGLRGCRVESFAGLLVDMVRHLQVSAVVRGIRSAGDYEPEWRMAGMNAAMEPACETIFLMARPELAIISSTLVREVVRHGGDPTPFVPPPVARALAEHRG
jgi:pantetheine-phosphate adenylyltransferase